MLGGSVGGFYKRFAAPAALPLPDFRVFCGLVCLELVERGTCPLIIPYKGVAITNTLETLQHGSAFTLVQGAKQYPEHGVGVASDILHRQRITRPDAADFIFYMLNPLIRGDLHITLALFQPADQRHLKR